MEKKSEEKKTNSTIALPVLEILRKESDKEHPLLQSQIIHFLKKKLPEGSRAPNRKTVKDSLDYLSLDYVGPKGEGYDIQPAVQGQGIFLGERLFDEGLALRLSMLIAESNEFTKSEKEDLIKAIYKDQSRYAEGAARPAINEAISQSPAAGMARSAILRSMTERIKDSIPVLAKLKEKKRSNHASSAPLGLRFRALRRGARARRG